MKIGIALTAHNRPDYFADVIASWNNVRGIERVEWFVNLEPSRERAENEALLRTLCGAAVHVEVNDRQYGVSRNPFVAMTRAFGMGECEYVILGEDDLVVSDDILEYHQWASARYVDDKDVALVQSFTHEDGDPSEVYRTPHFGVWLWGTWRDRWDAYIGREWDVNLDYYTDAPGHEVGWDWHLNKRVMPKHNVVAIAPRVTRSNSVGVWGQHSTPAVHMPSRTFCEHRDPTTYIERPSAVVA